MDWDGWGGGHDIVFYAKNDCIAGRNPIWVQGKLTTLIQMFEQVGLDMNLVNTKSMTFTTSFIWGKWRRRRTSGGQWGRTPLFWYRSGHG